MNVEKNGHSHNQEERLLRLVKEEYDILGMAQRTGFENLEKIIKTGFENVVLELKQTREAGYLPLPVAKDMLANMNNVYLPIIKTMAAVVVILVMWLTGLKYFGAKIFGLPQIQIATESK